MIIFLDIIEIRRKDEKLRPIMPNNDFTAEYCAKPVFHGDCNTQGKHCKMKVKVSQSLKLEEGA